MSTYTISPNGKRNNNGGATLTPSSGTPYTDNPQNVKAFTNKRTWINRQVFASTLTEGINIENALPNPFNSFIIVPRNNTRPLVKRASTYFFQTTTAQKNNLLTSGNYAPELYTGSYPVNYYTTRLESTAYRDGKYNIYTGKFDAGYPDNETTFLTDTAVIPSRNETGKIIFKYSKNISITPYQKKTG